MILRRCLLMLVLLFPVVSWATQEDANHCHDSSAWSDWAERTAKNQSDVELQTLHALWMGLCMKVEQGALDFQEAATIFERARDAFIQQRRAQQKESQRQNPL